MISIATAYGAPIHAGNVWTNGEDPADPLTGNGGRFAFDRHNPGPNTRRAAALRDARCQAVNEMDTDW